MLKKVLMTLSLAGLCGLSNAGILGKVEIRTSGSQERVKPEMMVIGGEAAKHLYKKLRVKAVSENSINTKYGTHYTCTEKVMESSVYQCEFWFNSDDGRFID